MIFKILLLSLSLVLVVESVENNVCARFSDYFIMQSNPNCWYNPDVDLDFFEILARRNISVETYKVTTRDKYTLTLFRLPRRANRKGVVYISNPLISTPLLWFLSNDSIGYSLYYEGYELWFGNERGSFYSDADNKATNYFDYTFTEIGIYDLPAQLDVAKNISKTNDIILVGYSVGSTSALVYASLLPDHAKKSIKLFILMAPSIFINQRPPMLLFSNNKPVKELLGWFNILTVFPSFSTAKSLVKLVCGKAFTSPICAMALADGVNTKGIDMAKLPFLFAHMDTRLPLKIPQHFYQISIAKRFQMYDYGEEQNINVYGTKIPPLYPIERINVPIYPIYGELDERAIVNETKPVLDHLNPIANKYGSVTISGFTHFHFCFGKSQPVWDAILGILNKI